MEKMKIFYNFINMNAYIIDFIDIGGYIHMICTLAQSHRLNWRLEPTGVILRASECIVYIIMLIYLLKSLIRFHHLIVGKSKIELLSENLQSNN